MWWHGGSSLLALVALEEQLGIKAKTCCVGLLVRGVAGWQAGMFVASVFSPL